MRVGWFGRMALKHVYYHMWNESPVQVGCMRQGAQGWCTGMTQRDGMVREVGGVFRMGNTCTPVADSCQCMAKPLQYWKLISLQLNKFILKIISDVEYLSMWLYFIQCEYNSPLESGFLKVSPVLKPCLGIIPQGISSGLVSFRALQTLGILRALWHWF